MKLLKTILLFVAVGFLTAFTLKSKESGYKIGDVIEDFSLKNIDDTMVSL